MDFYMYRAVCPGWLWGSKDIRHLVVPRGTSEEQVQKDAEKITKQSTGNSACSVDLLQKYHMLIEPKKSYPALTGITFFGSGNSTNISVGENIPSLVT